MQMAVAAKNWCDFFVFTRAECFLERVVFDQEYWDMLKSSCSRFFLILLLLNCSKYKSSNTFANHVYVSYLAFLNEIGFDHLILNCVDLMNFV